MNKLKTLSPKKKKQIMTTYEMIQKEGEVKKATEVVISSYKKGLEIGLIADITNLSVEEVQQILLAQGTNVL